MPKYTEYELEPKKNKDGKPLKPQKRWKVKGYLGVDPKTGKQKDTVLRGFKNKTAAEKAFADAQFDFRHGVKKKQRVPTVREAYNDWLPTYEPRVAESTLQLIKYDYDLRILPVFGDRYLDKITPLDAQRWVNKLATELVSYRQSVVYFSRLYKFAIKNSWITQNPFYAVDLPRKRKTESKHVVGNVLTAEELNKLLGTVQHLASGNPTWLVRYAFLDLVATTGMRAGEALALQWNDIDLDKMQLFITHHIRRVNGKNKVVKGGKTDSSVRTIPIEESAAAALKQWKKTQLMDAGIVRWVFTSPRQSKTHVAVNTARLWMQDACTEAGIRYRSLHAFRHTKATLLNDSSVNIRAIADILGHSNPTITANAYIHTTAAGIRQAESVYSSILEKSGSTSGSDKGQ